MEKPLVYDTRDKVPEVLRFLKEYDLIKHTNKEEEFDYLESFEPAYEIVNPYGGASMYVEFTADFTISTKYWHGHYAYDEDYDEYATFLDTLRKLLHNEIAGVSIFSNRRWLAGTIYHGILTPTTDVRDFVKKTLRFPEFQNEVKEFGGVLKAGYWNPKLNITIKL
jgi:hypothetical protein